MGFLNKDKLMKKAEGFVFQKPAEVKPADSTTTTATPVGTTPAEAPKDGPTATTTATASASTTPAAEAGNPIDEGIIIEQMGNGTTIRKHNDGHKSTTYPDGRVQHRYVDGSEMTIWPNGTKTYYTPHQPKEDMLDKAVSMGAKSLGLHLGRGTTEKISDKSRGFIEKSTGKKLNSKISN